MAPGQVPHGPADGTFPVSGSMAEQRRNTRAITARMRLPRPFPPAPRTSALPGRLRRMRLIPCNSSIWPYREQSGTEPNGGPDTWRSAYGLSSARVPVRGNGVEAADRSPSPARLARVSDHARGLLRDGGRLREGLEPRHLPRKGSVHRLPRGPARRAHEIPHRQIHGKPLRHPAAAAEEVRRARRVPAPLLRFLLRPTPRPAEPSHGIRLCNSPQEESLQRKVPATHSIISRTRTVRRRKIATLRDFSLNVRPEHADRAGNSRPRSSTCNSMQLHE